MSRAEMGMSLSLSVYFIKECVGGGGGGGDGDSTQTEDAATHNTEALVCLLRLSLSQLVGTLMLLSLFGLWIGLRARLWRNITSTVSALSATISISSSMENGFAILALLHSRSSSSTTPA
ncbi:hypothetical protein EGR_10550 [Echinococcus granulosus]|uniref:Uncharacterized protein n=1 Tax=Echinococcus granulosus TaxID=6210 RepID=W6U242_ECHGR|nr:hypothetical protein EGR_10550 [Echinococcus granulosus]EUB54596.1 hypothetical protein EGR_10550 [Echinococcus granulosus]